MDLAARQLRNLANQDPSQQTTTIARAHAVRPRLPDVRPVAQVGRATAWTPRHRRRRPRARRAASCGSPRPPRRPRPTGDHDGRLPGHAAGSPRRIVADHVTNRIGGVDRAVFTYSCAAGAPTGCPATRRRLHAHHATSPRSCGSTRTRAGRPAELRVVSSIFLRNQNEAPVADFTSTAAGTRTVILNALGVDRPRGPHARLRLVPRQRHDHADAGGGLRAGDQAEGQRHDADLPRPGHDLPLRGADRRRLADDHPARRPRPGLPVRDRRPSR